MQQIKWIVIILSLLLIQGAFAQNQSNRQTAAEGLELAVKKSRLLMYEEEKFDSQYPLKGQISGGAMRTLQSAGYTCRFDSLELTRVSKGTPPSIELYTAPIIACVQKASEPSDICAQRRVTLLVESQDEKLLEPESHDQYLSRPITKRGFWCVEQGELIQ